jgi:hypothetical protein
MKRQDHELDDVPDEDELLKPESNKGKKKKAQLLTKAAVAKKLLKKKVKINKKVVFSEDGEASSSNHRLYMCRRSFSDVATRHGSFQHQLSFQQ